MTVGLAVMTRNEADSLPRAHASVEAIIDGFTVLDVGSTDDTVAVARKLGATVHEVKWVDFVTNGTQLLNLAVPQSDYTLLMSANDTAQVSGPLPDLDEDQYMLTHLRDGLSFQMPALLSRRVDWFYTGPPVHSALSPVYPSPTRLEKIVIVQHDDDGRRSEKITRYQKELEQWHALHPDDTRTAFYLARSYYDTGKYEQAAAMYERRIALGGWEEEQWHAHYMKGCAQLRMGLWTEGRATLLAAYLRRPTRAEPLYALAKSMLPPDDLLFIELNAYGNP